MHYVASMLYFLPPSLTPTWFVKPLLATGGVVTVVAELGLGLCLMSWNSKAQRCGIVMAAVLHYLIAISPYPNQIPGFGVFCVTRMFHAMPNAWHAALHEAISVPTTSRAAAVHFAAAALVAVSTMATDTGREGPSDHIDWCIPAQTFLCLVGIRAIILDSTVGETWRKKAFLAAKKAKKVSAPAASLLLRVGGWGMFLATTMYVLEFQALGLMDISAVSHPWTSCSPTQVALIHLHSRLFDLDTSLDIAVFSNPRAWRLQSSPHAYLAHPALERRRRQPSRPRRGNRACYVLHQCKLPIPSAHALALT